MATQEANPTPEEIRQRCWEIQAGWDRRTRRERAGCVSVSAKAAYGIYQPLRWDQRYGHVCVSFVADRQPVASGHTVGSQKIVNVMRPLKQQDVKTT